MVWRKGVVPSTLVFNFALEYATKRVQATQEWLQFNGLYQRQVCVDDVSLLRENLNIIKKNSLALLVTSKQIGLEADTEETKFLFMPREQNAEQNHNKKQLVNNFKLWQISNV